MKVDADLKHKCFVHNYELIPRTLLNLEFDSSKHPALIIRYYRILIITNYLLKLRLIVTINFIINDCSQVGRVNDRKNLITTKAECRTRDHGTVSFQK